MRLKNFWFGLQTHFEKNASENQTFSSDFRQCVKSELFGNLTVIECLKSILHSSDFRHLLYLTINWVTCNYIPDTASGLAAPR